MTLGPDRRTIARWLSEPLYQTDAAATGGASGESGADTQEEPKPGAAATDAKKTATGDDPEAIAIEHGGKRYVLQSHVDSVASKARTEGREAGKKEVSDELERKAAEESGNWKKLYEDEAAKREAAELEAKTERLSALRTKIGAKHSLPEAIVELLKGDDEAALEAHAKELAKVLPKTEDEKKPPKKAPSTENGAGNRVRGAEGDPGDGETPEAAKRKTGRRFAFQSPGDVEW